MLSVMTVYWYRDRRSGSAECIMTGKGRRMEEEEGSAVTVMTVYWYRDRRSCSAECITHREREKDGGRGGECCHCDDCVLVQRQALR